MTNYLYESVDDAFDSLQDTKHVQFSNLMVNSGWIFDPSSYPVRIKPYRGYRNPSSGVTAWYDSVSYVQRFIDYLDHHNIITAPKGRATLADDSLLDFPRGDWNRIAQVMRRIIQRQFVNPLGDDIKNDWEIEFG